MTIQIGKKKSRTKGKLIHTISENVTQLEREEKKRSRSRSKSNKGSHKKVNKSAAVVSDVRGIESSKKVSSKKK